MRHRFVLAILMIYLALLTPEVVQSQDTTEAVDPVALQEVPVAVSVVTQKQLNQSCIVRISHSNWWLHFNEDKSTVDITCVYDVDIADDRKIERSRIKACRSILKERKNCGDDSRDFLRKARRADFSVSYEDNPEGGKRSTSDMPAFTMTVRAQIDLRR